MDALSVSLLIATFNKALIDLLAQPIQRRWPEADLWWMSYVAMGTGAIAAWFAGANIFTMMVNEIAGRILTCLAVGAGTNLINQVFTALPVSGSTSNVRSVAVSSTRSKRYRGW